MYELGRHILYWQFSVNWKPRYPYFNLSGKVPQFIFRKEILRPYVLGTVEMLTQRVRKISCLQGKTRYFVECKLVLLPLYAV